MQPFASTSIYWIYLNILEEEKKNAEKGNPNQECVRGTRESQKGCQNREKGGTGVSKSLWLEFK